MKALACVGMGKSESAIIAAFRTAGLEMDETALAELTEEKIKETDGLFVFTENFSPTVSAVCQKVLMPYLSYVTELPAKELYDEAVRNPCNFIFCFDAAMCMELEQRIPGRCFHLPLGAARQDGPEQETGEHAGERTKPAGPCLPCSGLLESPSWDLTNNICICVNRCTRVCGVT